MSRWVEKTTAHRHALVYCPIFGLLIKKCLFCQREFQPEVLVEKSRWGIEKELRVATHEGYVATLFCRLECSERYIHKAFVRSTLPLSADGFDARPDGMFCGK